MEWRSKDRRKAEIPPKTDLEEHQRNKATKTHGKSWAEAKKKANEKMN